MQESQVLQLKTDLSAKELSDTLAKYEPWGHEIIFNKQVSTCDFKRRVPFNRTPLNKIKAAEKVIPFQQFKGGRVLDIGCNSGHNSIYVASTYGLRPTGIDVAPRHIEVARLLSNIADIEADYLLENAETFVEEEQFDVVLHFGTLYHLPNPLLSLKSAYSNLKKRGWLALETQVYDHPDDENICYFMHMHNNDKTNYWALSTHVIQTYLTLIGFTEIQELLRSAPKALGENMHRVVFVARKQ